MFRNNCCLVVRTNALARKPYFEQTAGTNARSVVYIYIHIFYICVYIHIRIHIHTCIRIHIHIRTSGKEQPPLVLFSNVPELYLPFVYMSYVGRQVGVCVCVYLCVRAHVSCIYMLSKHLCQPHVLQSMIQPTAFEIALRSAFPNSK